MTGMLAGKPCRPSFPQAGLPSPFSPPSRTRIIRRLGGKKKKKVYNPISEGLGKVDRGTHSHPRESQAAAERLASRSLSPAPGWPGASGGPGTRPGRPPPGRDTLLPQRSRCLGPRALPGTCPWGWTKDATRTPGRGGDPVAGADNGLVERWGRGWLETRRTEGWGRACREAPAAAALHLPATRWG